MKITFPKIVIPKLTSKRKNASSNYSTGTDAHSNSRIQKDSARNFSNTYVDRDTTRQEYIEKDPARYHNNSANKIIDEPTPCPYIEADPARNIGLEGDQPSKHGEYIVNSLREALRESELSHSSNKSNLQKDIAISVDAQSNVNVQASNNSTVVKLLTSVLPKQATNVQHIPPSYENISQSLLIQSIGNDKVSIKGITHTKGDAISITNYTPSLPVTHTSSNAHDYVPNMQIPSEVIAQITRGLYQAEDSSLFRLENGHVYKLDYEKQKWNTLDSINNQIHRLIQSPGNGNLYQISDTEIKSVLNGTVLNTDISNDELMHIDHHGNMLGIRQSEENKQIILVSHIKKSEVSRIPIALPNGESITDLALIDGKLLIIANRIDAAGETEHKLYSTSLIAELNEHGQREGFSISTPLNSLDITENSKNNDFTLSSFHHDNEGNLYIKFAIDHNEYITPLDKTLVNENLDIPLHLSDRAWMLNDATVIENRSGLPDKEVNRSIELPTGNKLLLSGDAIFYEDNISGKWHHTAIQGNVTALETDGKGTKAYALVNNQVQSLSVGVPTTHFNISHQLTNSFAHGDATKVSATEHTGENIIAFAAATESLIVQVDGEGQLTVLEAGEQKTLTGINTLPDGSKIQKLAFDQAGNLMVLGDSGKLFNLDADELANQLESDVDSVQPGWHKIQLPQEFSAEETTIENIHSGPDVKVQLSSSKKQIPIEMSIIESQIQSTPSRVRNNTYNDFTRRSNYGHIHERTNKQTGEKETSLHKRQRIIDRMATYGAHIRDPFSRAPELIKQATETTLNGTMSTRQISEAAKKTHDIYKPKIVELKNSQHADTSFTSRIKSFEDKSPKAAEEANKLYTDLIKQLQDTLFQAAIERGLVNTRTGNVQITNAHVGKEFGYGERDIIQTFKKILSHLKINDQNKINELIRAFEQSNQGLIYQKPILGSQQAHSYRNLQISKEHLELIAVTLIDLDKMIKQNNATETLTEDLTVATATEEPLHEKISALNEAYQNNAVAKQNRLGVTDYKQMLNMENAMENIASALDSENSALSRSLRARCGTANHQETLAVMREVTSSMPKEAVIILGQDVRIMPQVQAAWSLPIEQLTGKPIGFSAYAIAKATVAIENKIVFSMMENGDLFVSINRENNKGLTLSSGIGATIGKLSKFFQPKGENATSANSNIQPVNLRPALRLNTWMDAIMMVGKEKGAILNIPANNREEFLEKLFGGNAASQVSEIFDISDNKTAVKALNIDGKINFSAQADVRGIVNVDVGIKAINTLLRVQAELRAEVGLLEVKYHNSSRASRGDIRHRVSDQIVHLIPQAYLQTQIRLLGAGENYVSEASPANGNTLIYDTFGDIEKVFYKRKVRPQDRDHEGTFNSAAGGMGDKIAHSAKKPINAITEKITKSQAFQKLDELAKGVDNKRISRFDERIKASANVTKDSYLSAISELAESLKEQYPKISEELIKTHNQINKSKGESYRKIASPIIQQLILLLAELQKQGSFESTPEVLSPLNNKQLSAINNLILLDAKKEAHDSGQYLQSRLRYTTAVTNINRLIDPGTVNTLAAQVGLGQKVDSAPHLARLMLNSADFKRIIQEEADNAWRTPPTATILNAVNATARLTFHPDVQLTVDRLAAKGLLTEKILDDLQMGKGKLVKEVNGNYMVIPDAQAGKNNMVPFQIEINKEKSRPRDFESPTPFLRTGTKTNISTTTITTTINLNYQAGTEHPISMNVERPILPDSGEDLSKKMAVKSAAAANIKVSSYRGN